MSIGPWRASGAEHYRMLLQFARREGHARIPRKHAEAGLSLGRWVHNARSRYREGQLTAEQVSALRRVPGWAWQVKASPGRHDFSDMLSLLRKYARREGHARVPQAHSVGDVPLGKWVGRRRRDYKRGALTHARIRLLESVPGWTWQVNPTPIKHSFSTMVRLLERYARREGQARVPRAHIEDGVRLGEWVAGKRRAYGRGSVPDGKVRILERLPGWSWRLARPRRVRLERVLEALSEFVKREGHARVPPRHREGKIPLGQWVNSRRTEFAQGRLSRALARRLERVPGWSWDPRREHFERMLAVLRRYVAREGHTRVPGEHVENGVRLGGWVESRRQLYHQGRTSAARIAALEVIPEWTWRVRPRQAGFERLAAAFRRFVRREGHGRVQPRHQEDGLPLGRWVKGRREAHRRGRLSRETIRRFEQLHGWVWSPRARSFQIGVELLRRFVSREGHARVPPRHVETGQRLGSWVAGRRKAYRLGRLGPREIALLEAFPAWHWRVPA